MAEFIGAKQRRHLGSLMELAFERAGLTPTQYDDFKNDAVKIEQVRNDLENSVKRTVIRAIPTIIVKLPGVPSPMSREQWLEREFERCDKVARVTGVALTSEQKQMVEIWDPEIWRPGYHIMPGGLMREPSLDLAQYDGVLLWGGRTGANCGGNDTPTVASIQQWDYEAILEGRRTGAKPFNMSRADQMAWCRENGDGPYLPVEWMYIHSTYQNEHHHRPPVLDKNWVWQRTEEQCDTGHWVGFRSNPGRGAYFHWSGYQGAYPGSGVGSRKCVLALDLAA